MKRIAKVLVCFALMIGLAYTPVMVPQLENTPVVATAEAATKVKLNKKSAVVRRGATVKLKMQGTKKAVKWSTSDKSIATVSKKGVVTGKKPGKVKITAKVGKKKYVCNVTVKNRISADTKNVTFAKANQKKTIKVTYVGTKEIWYNIDDDNVVSAKWSKKWNGNKTTLTLTAKNPGTTYVKLTNDHNKEVYKIKVTVKGPWESVEVVIPETLGDQDTPENRMQITDYQFFAGGSTYFQMKITFKCVEYGKTGRSNWGEYFYCYDKNGNLLDECYLYAGSLGLGRTYNDTVHIPSNTAKIVFEEYPVYNDESTDNDSSYEDEYVPEEETPAPEEETPAGTTAWSFSDVEKLSKYIEYARKYTDKASDYLKKGDLYNSLTKQSFGYAKGYYEDAYEFVCTKSAVNLTNGGTLADELKQTIELLGTVSDINDTMDLHKVNVEVAADNVTYTSVIVSMAESFL